MYRTPLHVLKSSHLVEQVSSTHMVAISHPTNHTPRSLSELLFYRFFFNLIFLKILRKYYLKNDWSAYSFFNSIYKFDYNILYCNFYTDLPIYWDCLIVKVFVFLYATVINLFNETFSIMMIDMLQKLRLLSIYAHNFEKLKCLFSF